MFKCLWSRCCYRHWWVNWDAASIRLLPMSNNHELRSQDWSPGLPNFTVKSLYYPSVTTLNLQPQKGDSMCRMSSVCLPDHSQAFSILLCTLSSCLVCSNNVLFCLLASFGLEWGEREVRGLIFLASSLSGYRRLALSLHWKSKLLKACPCCFKVLWVWPLAT